MEFTFSEEQQQFRDMVRQFLEASSPETAVREQMETEQGYDDALFFAEIFAGGRVSSTTGATGTTRCATWTSRSSSR